MTDWNEIERAFHTVWGQASSGQYDKSSWNKLQALLSQAKSADQQRPAKPSRKKNRSRCLSSPTKKFNIFASNPRQGNATTYGVGTAMPH